MRLLFRTLPVAALLTLGLLTACTTSEAGQATPGGDTGPTDDSQPPSSETSSDPGQPSVDIPPPPRELSLEGLDPCTLFTDAQLAQLKVNDVRPSDDGGDDIYDGMKECTLDADAAEPFTTYDVIAVTDVDVSFWLNERRNADAELISVAGYPAAQFRTKGTQDADCAIAVGVAKNQHLHVEMFPISEDLSQDELCLGSKEAAEMALETLQTLK